MNKLKVVILSLSLMTVMAGAAIAPALGAIGAYFSDADPLLIRLIITLPSLCIIFVSLLFSKVTEFLTAKSIALIGLAFYFIGGCGAGLANQIWVILIFRVLLGIGVGLIMPLSTGLLAIFFEKGQQEKLLGYSSAMNNLGGIIALAISGALVSMSWRLSFVVYILGLIEFIMIALFLPDVKFERKSSKLDRPEIMKIMPYMITIFLVMMIFYTIPTNFSLIVTAGAIIPTSSIGLVMAIQNAMAFFAGLKLESIVGISKSYTKYFAVGFIGSGMLILSLTTNLPMMIFALCIIGIGLGSITPLIMTQISQSVAREKVPSAMALMSFMLYLGQFLSPIVFNSITGIFKLYDLSYAYLFAAIFSFILCFGLIKVPVKR